MRYLPQKRIRFLSTLNNYSSVYTFGSERDRLVTSAGVLNFLWNNWNNFWREYWIAHIIGGRYLDDSVINPIYPNYNDKQACYYLLHISNKLRRRYVPGDQIRGTHEEATWGDPNVINTLSGVLIINHAHLNYVLTLLGTYQIQISHFQTIRNSFIHLNNENVNKLNTITGYYSFNPNQKVIDILESTSIINNCSCFEDLVSNLYGMIDNL